MKYTFSLLLTVTLLFGFGCSDNMPFGGDDPHRTHATVPEKIPAYTVQFNSPIEGLPVGTPQQIVFSITTKDNRVVKQFDVLHEKIMHVILVRKDLNTFDHIHPAYDETLGQFAFEHTFAAEGEYRMFADFGPKGNAPAVAFSTLAVGSGTGDYQALKPQLETKEQVGPYTIDYALPHNRIVAQEEIEYGLTITKNKKPVSLEPYLGAMGHSIILKENTLDYIHTHPVNANDLRFGATFPEPGIYAIFTQFQTEGKIHTAKRIMRVGDKNKLDLGDIKFDFQEVK